MSDNKDNLSEGAMNVLDEIDKSKNSQKPPVKEEKEPEVYEENETEEIHDEPEEVVEEDSDYSDSIFDEDSEEDEDDIIIENDDSVEVVDNDKIIISRVGLSNKAKKIKKYNPSDNPNVSTLNEDKTAFFEQYLMNDSKNSVSRNRSMSKVYLPYSGIYMNISSFSNNEMLSIDRNKDKKTFVEKIYDELNLIHSHIVMISSHKKKVDFEEWLSLIYYPDVWSLYYGAYNVNHPGINKYNTVCDSTSCNHYFEVENDNEDITCVSKFSKNDIDASVIDLIKKGADKSTIKSYTEASKSYKLKPLPNAKMTVFQGMPTMKQVLNYLTYLSADAHEDDDFIKDVFYPLNWLVNKGDEDYKKSVLVHKYMMFTKKLLVPIYNEKENGRFGVKTVECEDIYIPFILNKHCDLDDLNHLIKNKKVKELVAKSGIIFKVSDFVCPKCEKSQIPIHLDMRDVLFSRAAKQIKMENVLS